jgi:hypothetical protein
MFNLLTLKNNFGQYYIVRLSSQSNHTQLVNAEQFYHNHLLALHFIKNLQTSFGFWESIALQNSFYSYSGWQRSNPWSSIEEYIAKSLLQGSIVVYKTINPNELIKSKNQRSFKQQGITYEFIPATTLLTGASQKTLSFNQHKEAINFLDSTADNSDKLISLSEALQLSSTDNKSQSILTIRASLSQALLDGKIAIIEKQSTPVHAKNIVEELEDTIDQASSHINNMPPPANTNLENAEENKASFNTEEDSACIFDSLRLHCKHKAAGARKFELDVINAGPNHNGSQYALQVIAPPKDPDFISVIFNGVCRQGDETCGAIKVLGPNQSKIKTGASYCFKAAPKMLKKDENTNTFTHFLTTNLVPSLTDGLQYETYTVASQSCAGTDSHKAIIQAFPSFKWGGEISIGYGQASDTPKKREWITKGKISGNIGERTFTFDSEKKEAAQTYFPTLQKKLLDTLEQLQKFSSSDGAMGSLFKFDVNWPAISLGGAIELKESNKKYNVGLGGEIALNLNPLFGATVSVDIFDYLTLQTGGPIFLKYKKMAEKGEKHAVVLKAIIAIKGSVSANLKWSKGVDDTWLSTAGEKSAQAALGVTIGLTAEISVKTKIFYVSVTAGAKFGIQGSRSNAEGIGIITTLTATTAENKPAIEGSIVFTGATIYYSYYAEVGVKEAKSEGNGKSPGRKNSEEGGKPKADSKEKIIASKESKIEIFKYREWPNDSATNTPITIDSVVY